MRAEGTAVRAKAAGAATEDAERGAAAARVDAAEAPLVGGTQERAAGSDFPEGQRYAKKVTPGGSGDAFAGHGELRQRTTWPPTVSVPDGVAITMHRVDVRLPDDVGRLIEAGDWDGLQRFLDANPGKWDRVERLATHLPGAELPNYTLLSPDRLGILSDSMTVVDPTTLGTILCVFGGSGRHLNWAACTVVRPHL